MSDNQGDERQLETSSSGRVRRTRRPATRYGEPISWQEATRRQSSRGVDDGGSNYDEDDDGDGDISMKMGERGSKSQKDINAEQDSEPPDSDSLDEAGFSDELSDSEDEYRPEDDEDDDAPRLKEKGGKRRGQDRVSQSLAQLEADSVLYGSSDEGESLGDDENEEQDDAQAPWFDYEGEDARPQRTAQGRGGLETVGGWQEAAARKRHERQDEAEDGDADLEDISPELLRGLASAYSTTDRDENATSARWTSALHATGEAEEELDDDEYMQDVRGAMGFRRARKKDGKGRGGRQRNQIVLSPEVEKLLAEANQAFVSDEREKAEKIYTEVIRLDPKVRPAWAYLALINEEDGREAQAIQCRILEATLTSHPLKLWESLAERSKARGMLDQAAFCLDNAIKASREPDRSDVIDLMWRRVHLMRDRGNPRKAASILRRMLHFYPHQKDIVLLLVQVYYDLQLLDKATALLQKSQDWNLATFARPCDEDELYLLQPDPVLGMPMWDLDTLPTLADLYVQTDQPVKAIQTIRRGIRWMQGRREETFWDQLEDDREYDEDRGQRQELYGRHIELAEIHDLPIGLRFFLGIARARLEDDEEAMRHLEIWVADKLPLEVDAVDETLLDQLGMYVDEYLGITARLPGDGGNREEGSNTSTALKRARDAAEELIRDDLSMSPEARSAHYARYARCQVALGDIDTGIEFFVVARQGDPRDISIMMELAGLYEERGMQGDTDQAVRLVDQALRQRRENLTQSRQPAGDSQSEPSSQLTAVQGESFFLETERTATAKPSVAVEREQRKQREETMVLEALARYKRLALYKGLVFVPGWWSFDTKMSGSLDNTIFGSKEAREDRARRFTAVRRWLVEAEILVTMFCNTPQLYPSDRNKKFRGVIRTHRRRGDALESQAQAMLARLNDPGAPANVNVESADFRGIGLDDWTRLIAAYAFVLTKIGEYGNAVKVLLQVARSNIIYGKRRQLIQFSHVACAVYARDNKEAVAMLKEFMKEYQFHPEPLRILQTLANSIGALASEGVMNEANSLKMFLRRERNFEGVLRGVKCSYNRPNKRWTVHINEKDDADKSLLEGRAEREDRDMDDDSGEEDLFSGEEGVKADTSSHKQASAASIWSEIKTMAGIDPARHKPPTKYSPANAMLYASQILTSSAGLPSMAYWLRIFSHQQKDALICLAAAIACLGRATNRQVDNRNQVVLQANALMEQYRKLRQQQALAARAERNELVEPTISGVRRPSMRQTNTAMSSSGREAKLDLPEVNYNFGRLAHHMALYSLAVPHYQAVLQAFDEGQSKRALRQGDELVPDKQLGNLSIGYDAVVEAAYNLHHIYISTGNHSLANHIMERYLSV